MFGCGTAHPAVIGTGIDDVNGRCRKTNRRISLNDLTSLGDLMKKRSFRRVFFAGMIVAVACVVAYAPSVQAGTLLVNGTIALADMGAPTANTGNIQTATTFTLGNVFTTSSSTGYFVTYDPPGEVLGGSTL